MITTLEELAKILQTEPVRELMAQYGVKHYGEMSARALADAIIASRSARGCKAPAEAMVNGDLPVERLRGRPASQAVWAIEAARDRGEITWLTEGGKRIAAIIPAAALSKPALEPMGSPWIREALGATGPAPDVEELS